MENKKLENLKSMLHQVGAKRNDLASSSSLESMTGLLGGATLDVGSVENIRDLQQKIATESLDLLLEGRIDDIDIPRQEALEAIVMPYYRPVVDIINGQMVTTQLSNEWRHLSREDSRHAIERTFKSIGRLEIPHHPRLPYAGTGFIVDKSPDGRGILMTNRHVAEIFSTGIGIQKLQFRPGQTVSIDFLREYGRDNVSKPLTVEKVLMIHPYWDMALLRVVDLAEEHEPLKLSAVNPEKIQESEVITVGYPGHDPTGDFSYQQLQNNIFRGVFNVKRFQPGILKNRQGIASYDQVVPAITHDCSTLGGNSGSAVLKLPQSPNEPIEVVGLHFAGSYLRANYAVPTYDLASDSRVVDTGIAFSETLPPSNNRYGAYWSSINSENPSNSSKSTSPSMMAQSPSSPTSKPVGQNSKTATTPMSKPVETNNQTATWTVPLEVSVTFGNPELSSLTVSSNGTAITSEVKTSDSIPSTSSPVKAAIAPEEGPFGNQLQLTLAELSAMFSLTSLDKESFDWHTALSLAVASKLAYEEKSVVEATAQDSWGLHSCKFIDVEATQCFIASYGDSVLISFRGTKEWADWLCNLSVFSTRKAYGAVHIGFHHGFSLVKQLLEQELEQLSPSRVFLTGHSLGGALATVAAAEWNGVYPVTGVYTLGQPAVGKKRFSTFFSDHYNGKFFRFVNDDDIVTRVPPMYKHVGQLFHFNAQGGLKTRPETITDEVTDLGPKMMSTTEFDYLRAQLLIQRSRQGSNVAVESLEGPVLEGLLPSVSDHDLSEYIRRIKTQAS